MSYVLARGERFTVYHGDALDLLPVLETESVGLVIADPPYGAEWRSNRRAATFDELANDGPGDRDGIRAILAECVRLVAQNRHLYVFGPDDVLAELNVSDLAELNVSERAELIWHKGRPGLGDLSAPFGPAHERLSFAVSKHRHGGQRDCSAHPVRLRKGSVLDYPAPTGRKVRHPSEKPVALLRELVESSSRQGETVLDPFAGTGSTGVAAILSGRRTIAVELVEQFADLTAQRLQYAERLWNEGLAV